MYLTFKTVGDKKLTGLVIHAINSCVYYKIREEKHYVGTVSLRNRSLKTMHLWLFIITLIFATHT